MIFLSEAFTRPKVMKALAKLGFTQSYTYFTWRNTKQELTEYLTELTMDWPKEYMRPNFFPNTHDILPHVLQFGGRPAFKMRFVLAATLSSTYGIYSGFELCENIPRGEPGTTVYYQDSEVYEYKVWDWDRPGNIKEYIGRVNEIRRQNPALQYLKNLSFYAAQDDNILFYGKKTGENAVFVAVKPRPLRRPRDARAVPDLGVWDRGGRRLRGRGAFDGEGDPGLREAGSGSVSTRRATRRRSSASGEGGVG